MSTAKASEQINVLGVGIDLRSLDKTTGNSWQANVIWRNGRFESRGGFGTLCQYGSSLVGGRDTPFGDGKPFGYGDLLGSYAFITNEGHTQIISVHECHAFTGNLQADDYAPNPWLCGTKGQILDLLAVSVYDVTADRRVEWVLHRSTAELAGSIPLLKVIPQGQSEQTTAQWVAPGTEVGNVSFVQLNDLIYIFIPALGVYQYRPSDFAQAVNREINSLDTDTNMQIPFTLGSSDVGESGVLQKLLLAEGFAGFVLGANTAAGYGYVRDSEFAPPTCGVRYQNRMVFAVGKTLYFSDPDQPSHIIADNVYVVSTELPITAIAEVKGVLLIYTERETWMFQPVQADVLVAGGRIYNLSNNIGCISARHVIQGDEGVFWLDGRGVYQSKGGTDITRLSDPIDPWFSQPESMQNPATSYQVASGLSDLSDDQPPVRIDLVAQLSYGNLTWDQQNRILYCTARDFTLVWNATAGWSVWLYATSATVATDRGPTPVAIVGNTQNLVNPQLHALKGQIYFVGGYDETNYTDRNTDTQVLDRSYYILQLGRGGSLDRSSANQENRRQPVGSWFRILDGGAFLNPGGSDFFAGQATKLPFGFKTTLQTTTEDIWLMPIYLSNPQGTAIDSLDLRFTFDNTHWRGLVTGASEGDIDYILPTERLISVGGYQNGIGEVTIYNTGTGLADDNGNEVRIKWDGAAAPASWSHAPSMNLSTFQLNPIIYLPFKRLTGAPAAETVLDFDIMPTTLQTNPLGGAEICNCYVWREVPNDYPEQSLANDAVAQQMDWSLKSREVGDGKVQLKARGSFVTMESHGSATTKLIPQWVFGTYNTITTSDYRDFSAQTIDYTEDPEAIHTIESKQSIRARLQPPTSTSMQLKTGSNVARWGDTTDTSKGNLLIDDPAVDTIATSEGVRGEQFSSMIFGSLGHPAEVVKVQRIVITTRVVGGRRRTGR